MALGGHITGYRAGASAIPGEHKRIEYGAGYVHPLKSISQASQAVDEAAPGAVITEVWAGENWPELDNNSVVIEFWQEPRHYWIKPNDPGCDSVIVFSTGHMVLARTDEQSRDNPPPRLGKASAGTGSQASRSAAGNRKKTRGKRK